MRGLSWASLAWPLAIPRPNRGGCAGLPTTCVLVAAPWLCAKRSLNHASPGGADWQSHVVTDYIDPRRFDDEDELFDYILEHVVKPRIQEALGGEDPSEGLTGVAYVFGGQPGIDPEMLESLQQHLQSGMALDYILRELTDLEVRRMRESELSGLTVRYIELARRDDDPPPLSVSDLEAMFDSSPERLDRDTDADDDLDQDDSGGN